MSSSHVTLGATIFVGEKCQKPYYEYQKFYSQDVYTGSVSQRSELRSIQPVLASPESDVRNIP